MKRTFSLTMLLLTRVCLFAQASVSGVVTGHTGNPIQELEVALMMDNGNHVPVDDAPIVALTKTDSFGHYLLEGIPSGRYVVAFNQNHKDSMHQSSSMWGLVLSDNDCLLDVSLNMYECVEYCLIPFSPAEWKRISGKIMGLPVFRKAMIVFEVMETGEKQVVYTYGDGNFAKSFPPEAGRVKVHVFMHEGKKQWREVKSCIRRPQKRCQSPIHISVSK